MKPLFVQIKFDDMKINKMLIDDGEVVNMVP